jgi:hypothetical protein
MRSQLFSNSLGGVYKLDLSGCTRVVNVSALGQIHVLNLSRSNVVDGSALGGVHTLKLYGCQRVVDVKALSQVHNLDIFYCRCKCSWWGV